MGNDRGRVKRDWRLALSLAAYSSGEVIYNGTQIGTVGQDTGGTTIAMLADAEGTTSWTTAINSAWAALMPGPLRY